MFQILDIYFGKILSLLFFLLLASNWAIWWFKIVPKLAEVKGLDKKRFDARIGLTDLPLLPRDFRVWARFMKGSVICFITFFAFAAFMAVFGK